MIPGLTGVLAQRVSNGIKALWILVGDPVTRRRFPWNYLRRRLTRDPWIAWQLVSMVAIVIGFPLSLLLPPDVQVQVSLTLMAVWGTGLLVPFLRATVKSR